MNQIKSKEKLDFWQGKLADAETAYTDELVKMDKREKLYRGDGKIKATVNNDTATSTPYVRNICAELIESQIDSTIPQPKVTAMRKGDEWRAEIIENMLRSLMDKLPVELLNDMNERTVRIQGGSFYLSEWDESANAKGGEIALSVPHPKMVIPQDGVFTDIEDMDYIFLKIPQTRGYIERRYNVDLENAGEESPEVRSPEGDTAEDIVTQNIVYFRNEKGGIGRFSWVNDTVLEDVEDYQARRTSKCVSCGALEPEDEEENINPSVITDGKTQTKQIKVCPFCGGTKFHITNDDFETVVTPIVRSDGVQICEGARPVAHITETLELGGGVPVIEMPLEGTKIPFYKPNTYPILLQKNVSRFGSFLGDSDIDKLESYQNTIKRLDAKIIDKLIKSGSKLTLPDKAEVSTKNTEMEVIRLKNASEKECIGVYTLEGAIDQDIAYRDRIYEEAKQAIGVTDSYLGRIDRTATSGKAKEFSAAQAAGRMESKRVMKNALWARLYETCFKLMLAYDDTPMPIKSRDIHGNTVYTEFNRYDFLDRDENGQYRWNDDFLFSCDTSSALAQNREAMWQETRLNLQTGAFGDPAELDTLIFFWEKMEQLHYPGAGATRKCLEEKLEKQKAAAQMQMPPQASFPPQAQGGLMPSGAEMLI